MSSSSSSSSSSPPQQGGDVKIQNMVEAEKLLKSLVGFFIGFPGVVPRLDLSSLRNLIRTIDKTLRPQLLQESGFIAFVLDRYLHDQPFELSTLIYMMGIQITQMAKFVTEYKVEESIEGIPHEGSYLISLWYEERFVLFFELLKTLEIDPFLTTVVRGRSDAPTKMDLMSYILGSRIWDNGVMDFIDKSVAQGIRNPLGIPPVFSSYKKWILKIKVGTMGFLLKVLNALLEYLHRYKEGHNRLFDANIWKFLDLVQFLAGRQTIDCISRLSIELMREKEEKKDGGGKSLIYLFERILKTLLCYCVPFKTLGSIPGSELFLLELDKLETGRVMSFYTVYGCIHKTVAMALLGVPILADSMDLTNFIVMVLDFLGVLPELGNQKYAYIRKMLPYLQNWMVKNPTSVVTRKRPPPKLLPLPKRCRKEEKKE